MAVAIDTLRYADSFTEAGLEPRVAKVLAHAFAEAHAIAREDLVTKEYLDFRLAEFERRIDARFAAVDIKIAEAKVEMIRWIIGSQVAMLGAVVALANFTKLLG